MLDDVYKGNSGEWAELYSFLKLLGDGEFYSADRHFQILDDDKYPVCSIFRDNLNNSPLEYEIDENTKQVELKNGNDVLLSVTQVDFKEGARELLAQIKNKEKLRISVSDFLERIHKPKMKGKSSDKRDLTVKIYDSRIKKEQKLGFSVKSKLDGKATLFNSNGHSTSFLYKIKNFDQLSEADLKQMKSDANGKPMKNKTLIRFLYDRGCELEYLEADEPVFRNNLKMIDSNFDVVMANAVLYSYLTRGGKMTELVDMLIEHNPADYPLDTGHCFYEHKIRQFLSAAALGMTSASVWQGQYDATGGFIVVREDGALLCYHVYNWNDLQDYLFETTFLDQPSTGRHKYGMIEEENPDIIRLNFQVRFS